MTGVTGQKEEKKEKEKFLHTDGWTGTGTPIKGSTKGPRGPKKITNNDTQNIERTKPPVLTKKYYFVNWNWLFSLGRACSS